MTCERWRDAISAHADGENSGVDERRLAAHLARCAQCREFADAIDPVVTLHGGDQPPADLSRRVTKLAAIADRAATWSVVRWLLAVVAVEIIVMSTRALVLGEQQATSTHAARHLGAFTAAYGVGLVVVVARPARARTMLPVAAVVTGALVISAVVDLVERRIPLLHEAAHLPEVVSVLLLWLIAVPSSRPRRERQPAPPSPHLRVVEPDRRAG